MLNLILKLFLPVVAVIAGGFYLHDVLDKSAEAAALIKPVYILLCICFVIIFVSEIVKWKKEMSAEQNQGETGESHKSRGVLQQELKTMLICVGAVVFYLFGLRYIGFCLPTAAFLFAGFLFMKEKKVWLAALIAILLTAALYTVFGVLLSVPLPRGLMGF